MAQVAPALKRVGSFAISLAFVVSVSFLITILYRSVITVSPIEQKTHTLELDARYSTKVIVEKMKLNVHDGLTVVAFRTAVFVDGSRFSIAQNTYQLARGDNSVLNSVTLPSEVSGRVCIETTMSYRPTLSLTDHELSLPRVCIDS